MHNSDPNLHLLGEGSPIDWEEEFGSPADSDLSDEKRRRAKQVMSVIQADEGAPPYDVASLEESPDSLGRSPTSPAQGSPESLKELRTMLVKEFHVEAPVPVGEKAEGPLRNGTVIQEGQSPEEGGRGEAAPVADEHPPEKAAEGPEKEQGPPGGSPPSPAPPASSAADGGAPASPREPDDKETGEEVVVAAAAREAREEAPSEESPRATDDSEGTQTEF